MGVQKWNGKRVKGHRDDDAQKPWKGEVYVIFPVYFVMGLLKLSFAYWKENQGRDKKADKIQLHRMEGTAG